METFCSFATLGLLVVAGAAAVGRAKRYLDGSDERRESLESLAGLTGVSGLTDDERRAVASIVEFRMQRI